MDIEINFRNESADSNNSSILIFQKNIASTFDTNAVAWKVIKHCGPHWSHKFTYPMEFYAAVKDCYGNISDQKLAKNGDKFELTKSGSEEIFKLDQNQEGSNKVEVKNGLSWGYMDAQIYRGGSLLAQKRSISPAEKAVFEFKPTIWVGVVSEIEEGDVINPTILADINTEFSLLGIKKADLIMTGGGTGAEGAPFTFTLNPTA